MYILSVHLDWDLSIRILEEEYFMTSVIKYLKTLKVQ